MLQFLVLCTLLLPHVCHSQVPESPCGPRFSYVHEGNNYFGEIKLDRLERGRTEIKVAFFQHDSLTSNYYGRITPYPDGPLQVNRVPAFFRVHFPNPSKPPKLTKLSINGNVLCSGSRYSAPSSWFELTYTVNAHGGNPHTQTTVEAPTYATAPPPAPTRPKPTYTTSYTSTPKQRPPSTHAPSAAPPPTKFSNIFLTERFQQNTTVTCGTEGNLIRPFLHGGKELVRGQFPWMAAVYRKETVHSLSYICGGTLLSQRSVVSAAHCFQNLPATQVALFLGRTNLESFSEDGFVTRDVERLIIHPDYNNLPDADIAVMRMAAISSYTDFIRPICLWTESTQVSRVVGLSGTVAGWGSNENGQLVSPIAKRAQVKIAYHGRIAPNPDESTVLRNVLNRQPATFRVDFANPSDPPKLTLLSLDGNDLCVSSDYPPPKSWAKLSYQLYTYYTAENSLTVPDVPNHLLHVDLEPRPIYTTTYNNQLIQHANTHPSFRPVNFFPFPNVSNKFNTPTTNPAEVTPKTTSNINTAINSTDLSGVCGVEGTVVRGFVYGGVEVLRGQFPWLTAIYSKNTDALSFKCGGSLISRRTVISVAHCFRRLQAQQIVLFFGRHNLESYSEDGIVTRDANKLIIHTDYVNGQPNADLALLQIEPVEQFSEYIKPICLWSELDESSLIVGKTASVVGWGYEGERQKDISPLPKIVDVKIVGKDDCLSSSEAFQNLVTDKTICAGNRDGTGPCMGDSGGALMLQRNGRWVLRGVVSVGQSSRQRCDLFEYVVYCDAAKYASWIRQNLLD
ncbi:transmembrane protease serine 9 isoform X2 [Bactrocera oleae]|uniref:transmembrane protease serine 9 isoform X2 n=1 Tax=Bactrocera oleae TaxID=104688 RepID=UPI00387E2F7F